MTLRSLQIDTLQAAVAGLELVRPDGTLRALLAGAAGVLALVVTVAALYLVKSKLGINLMRGPSPLHGLLYQFIR